VACDSEAAAPQVESSQGEPAVQEQAAPQAAATAAQNPPLTGSGQTYYVDANGSDGSNGGADAPWQTLQFAASQVAPGDTILVQSGTYAGLRIEQSGSAEAWITLMAAPGASVLIDRPGPDNKHESNIELETWEGDETIAYWIIEGLEVANAPNWGIDTRGSETTHSHHIVIQGNTVHNNGLGSEKTGIFFAFVNDVVVTGNESYANGEHGIYLSNSGDRFLVQGNKLHHNNNCGLHMNGDESEGGDGIISEGVVEANVIYENGDGGCSAINMDGITDTIVRNNLLYQNHAGGISIFQENGALCSQRNRILNNTIVMAEDGRWAINVSDSSCVNNQIFNNVILTSHEWRGSILIPEPGIEGFESDYNVVMGRFSADDDNSVVDLAGWQALGYDANSFMAAPETLFVAAIEGDFRPSSGSPLLDAGIELPDVSEDLMGAARPSGGGYDSGAYESSGASQAPPADDPPAATVAVGEGVVTYTLAGRVYRLAAQEGATPEDISLALDALAAGSGDGPINVSPDGAWMAVESERFDAECTDWSCLVLLSGDLSSGEAIRAGGEVVHPEGSSAVASGGSPLVYAAGDGPHELDLWALSRGGSA
jgi:parallel beta-helix repeat protein